MAREYRRICFSTEELIEAIVSFDQLADQKLTAGFVISAGVSDDSIIKVHLDMRVYETAENITVTLDEKYLGAALVMYCLKNGIPIPRHSIRYLKRFDSDVALCLSINEAIEGPATVLPDFFNFDLRYAESTAA